MKKLTLLILTMLFTVSISSCRKVIGDPNNVFKIKYHHAAVINLESESLEIRFNKLIEDTRCTDTDCFIPGEVAVELSAVNTITNQRDDVIVGFHPDYPEEFYYNGHKFTLKEVNYGEKAKRQGKALFYNVVVVMD